MNPAMLDDRDTVTQTLGLFHQVGRQKHGLAPVADAPHELPDGATGLWVEAGRQFVEEHELGVVDEGQGDKQSLLLASRQRHEPGVPLVGQPELVKKGVASTGSG